MVIGLTERFGRWPITLFICFMVSATAMAIAAITDAPGMFFAAYVINYVADWWLRFQGDQMNRAMRRFGFGERLREFNRLLLLVVLALTAEAPGLFALVLVVTMLFLCNSSHAPLASFSARRRNAPVAVLNMDMSELKVPDGPRPGAWHAQGLGRVPGPELLVAASLAVVVAGGGVGWLAVGAVAVLVSLAAVIKLTVRAFRNRNIPEAPEIIEIVNRQLADYRPEVVLYFTFAAGGQDFMYQVNMWIDTLEKLHRRPIIVLRETAAMWQLEATRLPVVCIRKADDLALLDLSDVRVVLYPGNAGKNVHMLQMAEAQHVFIGHGDSDKLASSNRVSRVFDEIWVAGQAGKDRYRRVEHAIDPTSIVQVGRPQLGAVERFTPPRDGDDVTVLYGPTWEGWTEEACHTSLIPMGEKIIEGLLRHEGVRIIYKPHPLTGKRSAEAARAHETVQRLLQRDNERRAAARDPRVVAATEKRLAELERRMSELSGEAAAGDRLQRTRDARWVTEDLRAELEQVRAEWDQLFWDDAYQGGQHLIVTGRLPALYSCFNRSHVLISDMSSVISDFVASCKPYVVTNAEDLDPDEYRMQNPTAGGGYLLSSDVVELDDILAAVRNPDSDVLARRRVELKEYLLGPEKPTSMELFNAAVEALYAQGLRHFPPGTSAEPIPVAPDYTDIIPAQRTTPVREATPELT